MMTGLGAAALVLAGCSGGGAAGNEVAAPNVAKAAVPANAAAAAPAPPPALAMDQQQLERTCIPPAERGRPIARLAAARRRALNLCLNGETARQPAPRLPIRIDAATRFDRVGVEGRALVYRYRVDRRISELPAGTPDRLEAMTRHNACAGEDVRQILALGGAQVYRWVDRDEATIREVRIDAC